LLLRRSLKEVPYCAHTATRKTEMRQKEMEMKCCFMQHVFVSKNIKEKGGKLRELIKRELNWVVVIAATVRNVMKDYIITLIRRRIIAIIPNIIKRYGKVAYQVLL
jgi:hypothetical protein